MTVYFLAEQSPVSDLSTYFLNDYFTLPQQSQSHPSNKSHSVIFRYLWASSATCRYHHILAMQKRLQKRPFLHTARVGADGAGLGGVQWWSFSKNSLTLQVLAMYEYNPYGLEDVRRNAEGEGASRDL